MKSLYNIYEYLEMVNRKPDWSKNMFRVVEIKGEKYYVPKHDEAKVFNVYSEIMENIKRTALRYSLCLTNNEKCILKRLEENDKEKEALAIFEKDREEKWEKTLAEREKLYRTTKKPSGWLWSSGEPEDPPKYNYLIYKKPNETTAEDYYNAYVFKYLHKKYYDLYERIKDYKREERCNLYVPGAKDNDEIYVSRDCYVPEVPFGAVDLQNLEDFELDYLKQKASTWEKYTEVGWFRKILYKSGVAKNLTEWSLYQLERLDKVWCEYRQRAYGSDERCF